MCSDVLIFIKSVPPIVYRDNCQFTFDSHHSYRRINVNRAECLQHYSVRDNWIRLHCTRAKASTL